MFKKKSPIEQLVEQATSEDARGRDEALNLRIASRISQNAALVVPACGRLRKRLQNKNPKVLMLTLGLLEAVVKHGQVAVHREVASPTFMDEMLKVLQNRNLASKAPEVRDKMLALIYAWGVAFEPVRAQVPGFTETYQALLRRGTAFPSVDVAALAPRIETAPAQPAQQAAYAPPLAAGGAGGVSQSELAGDENAMIAQAIAASLSESASADAQSSSAQTAAAVLDGQMANALGAGGHWMDTPPPSPAVVRAPAAAAAGAPPPAYSQQAPPGHAQVAAATAGLGPAQAQADAEEAMLAAAIAASTTDQGGHSAPPPGHAQAQGMQQAEQSADEQLAQYVDHTTIPAAAVESLTQVPAADPYGTRSSSGTSRRSAPTWRRPRPTPRC